MHQSTSDLNKAIQNIDSKGNGHNHTVDDAWLNDSSSSFTLDTIENVKNKKNTHHICRNHSAAICAAIKDHESYLMEWIDYNLIALEFDQIYLYDNSDNYDLKGWYEQSRSHPIYSKVHITYQPGQYHNETNQYMQKFIYNDCVSKYGQGKMGQTRKEQKISWEGSPKHDYMAIFDTDEFIVFQQEDLITIHDLIDRYLVPFPNAGALAINWMYFGTSNHTLYSPLPVTKRFQYRDDETSPVIKTIVKSTACSKFINPHGAKLSRQQNASSSSKSNTVYEYVDTLYPGSIANMSGKFASNSNVPSNVVLLYHYRFMSDKEYWSKRCERGAIHGLYRGCLNGQISNKGVIQHAWPRPGKVFDDKAWKFLTNRVPKYRAFDDITEWVDFA